MVLCSMILVAICASQELGETQPVPAPPPPRAARPYEDSPRPAGVNPDFRQGMMALLIYGPVATLGGELEERLEVGTASAEGTEDVEASGFGGQFLWFGKETLAFELSYQQLDWEPEQSIGGEDLETSILGIGFRHYWRGHSDSRFQPYWGLRLQVGEAEVPGAVVSPSGASEWDMEPLFGLGASLGGAFFFTNNFFAEAALTYDILGVEGSASSGSVTGSVEERWAHAGINLGIGITF